MTKPGEKTRGDRPYGIPSGLRWATPEKTGRSAMTWVPDQHKSCMVGYGEDVRAIGWLGNGRPYPTGKIGLELQGLLESHVRTAWAPVYVIGFHTCDLDGCPEPARDSRNLWVPTPEVVYIAPAMVSHYVKVHS